MIFLPHWRWTKRILATFWPIVALAVVYAVLLLSQIGGGAAGELMNPSLDSIAALLGTPEGATIGWVHFLVFDLFVGRWVYLDSRTRNISAWLVSPSLVFVLMSGPLGLLIYLGVRAIKTRRREALASTV